MNPAITDEQLNEFQNKWHWTNLVLFGRGLPEPLLKRYLDHAPNTLNQVLSKKYKHTLSDAFKQEIGAVLVQQKMK